MRNPVKIIFALSITSVVLILNSCIKEEFDANKIDTEFVINPSVAAPLAYIHYELDEVLDDTGRSWNVRVESDSLILLEYETEVSSRKASELIEFSRITQTGSIMNNSGFDLELGLLDWAYDLSLKDTINLILNLPDGPVDTRIDSIQVDSLIINIDRNSEYPLRGWMLLRSSKIRKIIDDRWNYWETAVKIVGPTQTVTVTDVTIILSHDPPNFNMVPIEYKLKLDQARGTVPAGYPILNFTMNTIDLDFKAIYGFLGKMNFRIGPQENPIDFFTELKAGTFHFTEPRLQFNFENSFGMPVQIVTTDLYSTSQGGTTTEISGPGLPLPGNEWIINYPAIEDLGKAVDDSMIINYDEANLVEVIDASPVSISFGMEAGTNPQVEETFNFVTSESRLNVISKLILPIAGYTEFMNIEDSVMYEFSDFFQNPPEEIKSLSLRLNFINGFPVDISSQIYFLDESGNVVDSVFNSEYTIDAGQDLDGDGLVDPVESDPVEVEFPREKIDNMVLSRYFYFKGRLNTHNSDIPVPYKFYSFYFLDVYMGVIGDLELNSTGN